jgi:hypothetical protein
LCTEQPDLVAECAPPDGASSIEEDGEDGIDNALGHRFVQAILVLSGDLQASLREQQELGRGVTLVRVRGWNGEDDDPRVDVVLAPSVLGTPSLSDGGQPTLPADGGMPAPPAWDGSDYWWASEGAFVIGERELPRIWDGNAYVRDRTLVVNLPDRELLSYVAADFSLDVRLTGAKLTGRISSDETRLVDATLAGRWTINDILASARNLGFCGEDLDLISTALDQFADIRETPGSGGPSVPCNAISVGVQFTGYHARWAGILPEPESPDPCEPDGG